MISFQNGVSNAETLRKRLLPEHDVLQGMVPYNVVAARPRPLAPRAPGATSRPRTMRSPATSPRGSATGPAGCACPTT